MSKIKKMYSLDEVCELLGITMEELLRMIKKLFPDFAKRPGHKITEDELSQIETAIKKG